ncbi:MAG: hypothetical protein JSW52_07645 [Candidatus Coatesbacteria bacterium]|nr:MAG: hypothetical protein JSW52_07645 [Candidatus Coatesbacteria bacterium]
MMRYFLASLLVVSTAFAVAPDMVTGSGITIGSPSDTFTREEQIYMQSDGSGGNSAYGSMWYEGLGTDGKTSDNFQVDEEYETYALTSWDIWFCLWYGSWNTTRGFWYCVADDGGSNPATYEPYEYGSNPGWHDDVEDGNGGLGYVTDVQAVDYNEWGDMEGTGSADFYLWGYYPVYKTSGWVEDAVSGGWAWAPGDEVWWFWGQFYANPTPYGGPTDNTIDHTSGGMTQHGWTGTSWDPKGYGMMFNLYGDVQEEDPPVITDMYPQDGDFPSGVPVDTLAGCHWTEPEETDVGINVDNSYFDLYDGDMDLVVGILTVDDTDLFDVIVDFEPDDDLNEGETYTVETYAEDLAGNNTTETWDFTTGYMNITPSSVGVIKAGFAQ